jgi:hypothetical protein
VSVGAGPWVNAWISRRVIAGASIASPAATTRIAVSRSAGSASLSRNPDAPPRSAANTWASWSNVVSTRTRGGSAPAVSRAVAVSPSMPGIRTSISTTSGLTRSARASAAAPSAASPTTHRSGSASTMAAKPARTTGWSSTTITRMTTVPPPYSPRKGDWAATWQRQRPFWPAGFALRP